jgi:hypothetical protein
VTSVRILTEIAARAAKRPWLEGKDSKTRP